MQQNNGNNFAQRQNKGFTIHLGDEYVGHLVINEDRVNPKTVAQLQKPEIMKTVLASVELRPFVPKEERGYRDTSGLEALINSADEEAEDKGSPLDQLSSGS